MSDTTLKTTFQLRRGTAAEWVSANPTLAQGEPGFESDTYKLKLGDGTTAWNNLSYFGGTFTISADGKSIQLDSSVLSIYGFDGATAGQVPSKGSDGKIQWVAQSGAAYTAGENITISNNVISATDTKYTAGTNVAINNNVISATDTVYDDTEVRSLINAKTTQQVSGTNGTALIFNESDGGGAKFENNSGIESFIGVNDGGTTASGLAAQIYADKYIDGAWKGAKLDVTNEGMYYTVGSQSFADRAIEANEIATKGNISSEATARSAADAALQTNIDAKSTVSVSSTGTATDTVQYITVNGVEKKLAGGGSGVDNLFILNGTALSATAFEISETIEEVQAAIIANKLPVLKMELYGGNECISIPLSLYKSNYATLLFTTQVNGINTIYELMLVDGTSTYEGVINTKTLNTVSVASAGTAVETVQYITVDGVEKKLAGGAPTLSASLTVGYTIGGISEGKVYAAGTEIETILRDLFTKVTPTQTYLYYGVGKTIPSDVSGLTAVAVDKDTLLDSGYTLKNLTLDEEYAFLAIDNSLGLSCYEILQSGFALGFTTKSIGDQTLYYPDTPITDTGVRLVYHFEEA